MRAALREIGIATYRIRRSAADDRAKPGLRLATMHRVKGLEFDRMIVAGVNDDTIPLLVSEVESDDRGCVRKRRAGGSCYHERSKWSQWVETTAHA